ncbi:molybdenum cofactor guanylyltransferase [Idiomarina sp.]|uniref:molybdenum cofactor guanylyltransferase n=1 Tax=Idiomarina sp. TaxID=1874361 RepID=UPI0026150618|nr:molybdenum cofactor guanylyltransferase [Idiomarina sp.]
MPGGIPFSGLLLAGGRSRRMGTDKALLPVGETPLLDIMVDKMYRAGCDDVVVSRNESGYTQDIIADKGPLSGLHAGLPKCHHPRILVVPVDMPGLTVDAMRTLATASGPVYFEDCALPCALKRTADLKAYIEHQLRSDNGRLSVYALLKFIRAKALPRGDERTLYNTNTPEQWSTFWRSEETYHEGE